MGITYNDDYSKEPLEKDEAFTIEATRFSPSGDRLQKSKRFYVSMKSLTAIFGDTNFEWKVLQKTNNGWEESNGPL